MREISADPPILAPEMNVVPAKKELDAVSIRMFHPVMDGKADAAERAAAIQTDITMLAH